MQAWDWQHRLVAEAVAPQPSSSAAAATSSSAATPGSDDPPARHRHPIDSVLLLQHPPVYTLGAGSAESNLLFDPAASDVPLYRTERGGEVTYHGPGQVRAAPLRKRRQTGGWPHLQPLWTQYLLFILLVCLSLEGLSVPATAGATRWRLAALPLPLELCLNCPLCLLCLPWLPWLQLVMYPILNLQRQPYRADLHWYLRSLEQARHQGREGSGGLGPSKA
jgi:hypothetical protein